MTALRGADIFCRSLAAAGLRRVFALSGNHIMPLYDAAIEAKLVLTHVRYEGAAVHMADAWARLSGEPGIVWLTGGPGHANGVGALYTALAAESPLVLVSGHAPLNELGRGAFQEMRQADIAAPLCKASWTVARAEDMGADIAKACRIARSGRPGPVHLSLPADLLDAKLDNGEGFIASAADFRAAEQALDDKTCVALLAQLQGAARPLILLSPVMSQAPLAGLVKPLAAATGVPALVMESPRGVNDPSLGAFAGVLAKADLIVLIGKQPDFTLKFAKAPTVAADCRFVVIDADAEVLQRSLGNIGAARVALSAQADTAAAVRKLTAAAAAKHANPQWVDTVTAAVAYRPSAWKDIDSGGSGPVHPVELGRAVQAALAAAPEAVFVADGGEIGQWAQACISAPVRVINGVGGSIGSGIPFAFAARMARSGVTVIAVMGDGSAGFHLMEFDTAVREGVPMVVVIGNDTCWNAEYQIQLRSYGKERAHGLELQATRYDQVVAALGGHGELVTRASELKPALERALASGKPACVNVMIQRIAAPTVTLPA